MSPTATYIAVGVLAYLLGSIPFGYLLVKVFKGSDIRESGSGNIGATNVARSGSKALGLLTLLLDAGKGALAVWLTILVSRKILLTSTRDAYEFGAVAALCAICGHMFPVWLGFRGGKGVATAAGGFAVIAPVALLSCLGIFVVIAAVSRFVSLGSIISVAAFPFVAYFLSPTAIRGSSAISVFLVMISMGALLVIAKHHSNIRRLLSGTEDKFRGVSPPGEMERHA
jgi:glycerol-3-phosphate acyltransferase PlsY